MLRNPNVKPKAKPKPLTDVQIAQQQLKPAVDAVTGAIQGQAQRAGDAVRGYTSNLAKQLAGIDFQSPYASAVPQQAAVDEALRASLAGQGAELSQGLASRLAALNAPNAVDPAAASVADFGARAGATAQATGSATLGELLANKAAAGVYGLKLPGIARLSGIQNLGRVEGQAVQDIADETAPLYGKIPDIVSSIQSNRVAQQDQRTKQQQIALENALTIWQTTGKLPKGYAKIIGLPAGTPTLEATPKPATPKIVHTGDGSVVAVDPTTGQTVATISGPRAPKPSKPQTFQGTDGRTYIYDPKSGTAKPIPGQSPAKPTSKKGTGGLTPHEIQVYRGKAYTIADDAYNGYDVTANGTTTHYAGVDYKTALQRMRRAGIPINIAREELERAGFVSPSTAKKQQTIADSLFPPPLDAIGGQ